MGWSLLPVGEMRSSSWKIHGVLSPVPWRRRPQGCQRCHRHHQDQEDDPICRLVSHWLQGKIASSHNLNFPFGSNIGINWDLRSVVVKRGGIVCKLAWSNKFPFRLALTTNHQSRFLVVIWPRYNVQCACWATPRPSLKPGRDSITSSTWCMPRGLLSIG